MSANTEKFGIMFMSQGAETYKNISIQSKYFLELMKQQYELSKEQARSWAPDSKTGIVAEMMAAIEEGAKAAGDAIMQDAYSALITGSFAVVSMLGVVGTHFGTSTKEVQGKIDDGEKMRNDLNDPSRNSPVLEDVEEEEPGAQLSEEEKLQKERNQKIREKINDWSAKGGKTFENYDRKMTGLEGELPDDISTQNEINKEAVEHAKSSPERDKIQKNLDDYINDLKSEKQRIEQQFWSIANMLTQTLPSLGQGITFFTNKVKADKTAESQVAQGVSQVLGDAEKKQAQFFETSAQKAQQFAEAADSIASSLGQIMQNRSGA